MKKMSLKLKAPDLILPAFSVTTGNGKKRRTTNYPTWNFTEEARKNYSFNKEKIIKI